MIIAAAPFKAKAFFPILVPVMAFGLYELVTSWEEKSRGLVPPVVVLILFVVTSLVTVHQVVLLALGSWKLVTLDEQGEVHVRGPKAWQATKIGPIDLCVVRLKSLHSLGCVFEFSGPEVKKHRLIVAKGDVDDVASKLEAHGIAVTDKR